jgi:ElaB/YqjD/DUF883 family membrane-anchored ribosome-binding protein
MENNIDGTQIKQAVHDVTDTAVNKAVPKVNTVIDDASAFADKVSEKAADAVAVIKDKAAKLKDKHSKAMETGRDKVREQPAVFVAAAMFFGFILAKLMNKKVK